MVAGHNNAKKSFRRPGCCVIFSMFVLLLILDTTEVLRSTFVALQNNNDPYDPASTTATATESKPTIQEQFCNIGIFNNYTKQVDVNPECHPNSQKLLYMKGILTTKKITFFLIYYNDHHHLAHQLQSWKNFSQDALQEIQFLIVDDGSAPGYTAKELLQANYNYAESIDIVIYYIEQDLLWNIGGARNLGFWMANTEWIFMSDADIYIPRETMDYVVRLTNQDVENFPGNAKNPATQYNFNVFVKFQRYTGTILKPHPAAMLLTKSSYWYVGGCDEDFVGSYGYTDPHFRYKVEVDPILHLINVYPHMDKHKIPPLVTLADHVDCPPMIQCLPSFEGYKASRDVKRNQKMFSQKVAKGEWSNKVFRYTWHHEVWKWSNL